MKITSLFKDIENIVHLLDALSKGIDLPAKEIPQFKVLYEKKGSPLFEKIYAVNDEFLKTENYTVANYNRINSFYSIINGLTYQYSHNPDFKGISIVKPFAKSNNLEKSATIMQPFIKDDSKWFNDFFTRHWDEFEGQVDTTNFLRNTLKKPKQAINLQEHINTINNAFFRLESYMNGRLKDYKYFGFLDAFALLFREVYKSENFTYDNCKLIDHYWKVVAQISYDYDKSDFENTIAYENENFCEACNEIISLSDRPEEFVEFSTPDELEEAERKASITDILKPQSIKPTGKAIKANITIDPEALPDILSLLKKYFNPEQHNLLEEVLSTCKDTPEPLIFLANGNRLADYFKKLYKSDAITGCTQRELEAWILKNFQFRYRGKSKSFTAHYLNDIISSNKLYCKNPLIN
jgi:hypothetical protein